MNPIQSTLKSKIEYSKISSLKNKTSSHVKYCAIYFLFLFIFLSLFVILCCNTKSGSKSRDAFTFIFYASITHFLALDLTPTSYSPPSFLISNVSTVSPL